MVKKALECIKHTQRLYADAENVLLSALEAGNADRGTAINTRDNINVKPFSFASQTARLDAEYYLPKYERNIKTIQRHTHTKLGKLVRIKKSIEPGSDVYAETGTPFIRVADYNQFGITAPDKYLNNTFCRENAALIQSLYPHKETILFAKDGSIGKAYMLRDDLQAVTSGAVLHLTMKDKQTVLPDYLTLVLNSPLVKLQAERDAGGSIILHWRIDEIENVLIPLVSSKVQSEISSLVSSSFSLRSESEALLAEAKLMVEKAIEKRNGG